jgi:hypothetical protein
MLWLVKILVDSFFGGGAASPLALRAKWVGANATYFCVGGSTKCLACLKEKGSFSCPLAHNGLCLWKDHLGHSNQHYLLNGNTAMFVLE